MLPKVVIILVNYNGYEDTLDCLKSLNNIDYSNYEVIVVDNASTKKAAQEQLKYIKDHSIFIQCEDNLGFAGGNNIGIKYAEKIGYDYILLLNNDTIVTENFLTELVEQTENNSDVGLAGAKIFYNYDHKKVWYAGGYFNLKNGTPSHNTRDLDDESEISYVNFVTGCLMLIKRFVIEQVGLLDESFFMYSEDNDYCCRLRQKNIPMIYCSRAVIYHKVSASTGEHSPMSQYYERRNNLYLIKKYGTNKLYAYIYNICRDIRNIIFKGASTKAVILGYYDFIKNRTGKREL